MYKYGTFWVSTCRSRRETGSGEKVLIDSGILFTTRLVWPAISGARP